MTSGKSKYGDSCILLIVDAGGTKTDAVLLDRRSGAALRSLSFGGVNPIGKGVGEIGRMTVPLKPMLCGSADVVWFGAGCLPGAPSEAVASAMRAHGASGCVSVESDMKGAGLALFGEAAGIACILGTGSNTCLMSEGECRTVSVPPLGYILGDEGSGTALGKRLFVKYARRVFSDEVTLMLEETVFSGRPYTEALGVVYSSRGREYLASIAKKIWKMRDIPEIREVVKEEFRAFFSGQLSRYPRLRALPVAFVGSVAFGFGDILREVAGEYGVNVTKIDKSPLEGLIRYFRER